MSRVIVLILVIVTENVIVTTCTTCVSSSFDKNISDVGVKSRLCSQKLCFTVDPSTFDYEDQDPRLANVTWASMYTMDDSNVNVVNCGFSSLPKLQVLDCSKCKISDVFVKAFAYLPRLKYLSLAFNEIQILRNGFISNTPLLEVLDLSWNKLHRIEEGAFKNLNLQVLNLSRNELTYFSIDEGSGKLQELILSHNYIKILESRSQSRYTGIPKIFDLSFNLLADQPQFECSMEIQNCSLQKMDLTHNYIQYFSNFPLHTYTLEELRLSFNLIKYPFRYPMYHYDPIHYFPVKRVSIYPNPWDCQEGLKNILQILDYFNTEIIPPETDKRFNITSNSYPVCAVDNKDGLENYKNLVEEFVADKGSPCDTDEKCASDMICRNGKCWNPCMYGACDSAEICTTIEHKTSCRCPEGMRKNPFKPFSRCYSVECFINSDCKNDLKCKSHICV